MEKGVFTPSSIFEITRVRRKLEREKQGGTWVDRDDEILYGGEFV